MNYELAKQLKDAGFPQDLDKYNGIKSGREGFDEEGILHVFDDGFWRGGDAIVSIPTLEELIEACITNGDFHLECFHDEWQASVCLNAKGEWEEWHKGSSPLEAVANLWIALHEKKS